MNVLEAVHTDREWGDCILWSTQEPCSMCSAAAAFVGVGELPHIAPTRGRSSRKQRIRASRPQSCSGRSAPPRTSGSCPPTSFFLLSAATKRGADTPVLVHNLEHEPETAGIVVDLLQHGQSAEIWTSGHAADEALADIWPRIVTAAGARRRLR